MKKQRTNIGAVILGIVAGLGFAMILLGFGSWFTPKPAKAVAGAFAVYREATAGDTITTSVTNLDWDTTVTEGSGFSKSGADITLTDAGHYFVTYTIGYQGPTGGGSRLGEIQARIDVNGTDLPVGRSTCSTDNRDSADQCWLSGAAFIETSGASQTVRIETYRTDSDGGGVTRLANESGISILRVADTWDFGRYQEAGGGQTITSGTYASVNLDTNDEQDSTFIRAGDNIDLGSTGHYLVTYNVHMVNTSGAQRGNDFRITVGGTEVPGSRTSSYYISTDSKNDHVASWTGIIENATAGNDLVLEGRCNSEQCSNMATLGGAVGITIAKLPDSADYIRLYEAGGGQAVDGTTDPILWDTESEEDAGSFSHDTMSNTSRINIDQAGDYLFLGSMYMDRSPLTNTSRMSPHWEWRENGSTIHQYGSFAKFNRGDNGTAGVGPSGASAALILNGLTDTDYIELVNTDESSSTDSNATFIASRYAVQAVNIATLFPTDATVSSIGTQVATTSPSTTDLYVGGAFVITETGGGSRNVTAITITENGSVNAQTGLDNIRLYYESDTTDPYDCASVSFSGFPTPSESQFGSTDTDGFSGANGISAFSGTSVSITTTSTMCVYVALDVLSGTGGTTMEIEIADASADVTISAGTIGPSGAVVLVDTTTIVSPDRTQIRYHWRNDNGNEASPGNATSATSGNEDWYFKMPKLTGKRLRIEVSNEGSIADSGTQYRLEYGELGIHGSGDGSGSACDGISSWTDVGAGGGDWDMLDSTYLTDGNNTTDIAEAIGGMTNENTTFETPNNAIKDTSSQTVSITLGTADYVDIEYSVQALAAASDGAMYCFRVTDAGTVIESYNIYPRVVVESPTDFFIQRGFIDISGSNGIITAGVDYLAPSATSDAFITITNAMSTGAGRTTDDDINQPTAEASVHVANGGNLLTSVQFNTRSASADTRVTWEIIEYQGAPGGGNEFIVRNQGAINYSANGTSVSQTVGGVADGNDAVPWITGQSNPNATVNEYDTLPSTSTWNSGTGQIDFQRGRGSGNISTVSWALVEFTGPNWIIQRVENTYSLAGTIETVAPSTNFGSVARTFLHVQKRMNQETNVDEFGHTVWISATNAVSFLLQAGADRPARHVSVAFAIENTQTTDTPMVVTQSNGTISSGGTEPRANDISIGITLGDISVTSISMNMSSAGSGQTFPDPLGSARIISTTQYEIWVSETSNTKAYRTEVIEWPDATPNYTQNYYRWYVDNDALNPADPWPAGVPDLAENAAITASDSPPTQGDVLRIRMSIQLTEDAIAVSEDAFKLQFAQRSTTCSAIGDGSWTNLGNPGSGTTWRGYNASPADGTTISVQRLTVSDVNGTYEEQNNTALNPNGVAVDEDVEFDWVIENNTATPQTTWCFRMRHDDDTNLDAYTNYPTTITSGFQPESRNWRWYDDEINETPTAALAAENIAPSGLLYNNTIKLRFTIAETGGVGGTDIKFRLQYSEFSDFSAGVSFLVDIGSCTEGTSLWCYADGTDVDEDPIQNGVLSDSAACSGGVGAGCGVHNEDGTSPGTFDPAANTATEYEFTLRHVGAKPNVTYYFRAYDNTNLDPIPLDTGETYPSISTEGSRATLTISGVSSGTAIEGITTDITTTATTIPYGMLPFATETEAAQTMTIDTNATQGYQVFFFEDQQFTNGTGGFIDPVTGTNAAPSAWATGCTGTAASCYGYHAGDNVLEGGSGRFASNDTYARYSTSLEEVAYAGNPVDNESHDMVMKIEVRLDSDTGSFTNTLTYILVPIFN